MGRKPDILKECPIQIKGKLCFLKNSCCGTHKCCSFCNEKACSERCTDSYKNCVYRTDKIREIGKPWDFNIKKL